MSSNFGKSRRKLSLSVMLLRVKLVNNKIVAFVRYNTKEGEIFMQSILQNRNHIIFITIFTLSLTIPCFSQGDGYLHQNDDKLFPIGMYELPDSNAALKAMTNLLWA